MARATPTGVSALVDAYGRSDPRLRLGLGEQGVIQAPLPPALAPTPYSRLGDGILLALLSVSALSAFKLDVRQRLSDTPRPSA